MVSIKKATANISLAKKRVKYFYEIVVLKTVVQLYFFHGLPSYDGKTNTPFVQIEATMASTILPARTFASASVQDIFIKQDMFRPM